jgi:hypothetical protein
MGGEFGGAGGWMGGKNDLLVYDDFRKGSTSLKLTSATQDLNLNGEEVKLSILGSN